MTEKHWTAESADNLRFSVLCDFADQIHDKMQEKNISYDDIAVLIGVHRNVVVNGLSKLYLPPFDLLLKCAFALDLKLTIVTYPKEDDSKSVVHSSILQECWDRAGNPRTAFDLEEKVDVFPMPDKPKVRYIKEGSDKETEK
jgi:transcriptional regulator with XRE-family HTH domain